MMKISLCLLVWNEMEGCKIDLPKIDFNKFDEVYAIDGGSTDGTVEYLETYKIPVHKQPKKGLNAAYTHAVDMSTCDAVIVFFPKGTTPVEDLYKFREKFDTGYELIVTSRMIKGAINEEDKHFFRPRKWAVKGLAIVAAIIWKREGYRIRDVLHGVKGFTKNAFVSMNILDHGLSIDIEMVIRSYKLRIKRTEFPTIESPRLHGESHFKFWKTGKQLLKYLFFELFRKK